MGVLLESEEELTEHLSDNLAFPNDSLVLLARLGNCSSGSFLNHSLSSGDEPVSRSEIIY